MLSSARFTIFTAAFPRSIRAEGVLLKVVWPAESSVAELTKIWFVVFVVGVKVPVDMLQAVRLKAASLLGTRKPPIVDGCHRDIVSVGSRPSRLSNSALIG